MNIQRRSVYLAAVTMHATAASATPIQIESFDSGVFAVTSLSTQASVTFAVSDSKDGTYRPLHDSTNTLISYNLTDEKAYQIPAAAFGSPWLKLIADAGSGVAEVYLKT